MLKLEDHAEPAPPFTCPGILGPSPHWTLQQEAGPAFHGEVPSPPQHSGELASPLTMCMGELTPDDRGLRELVSPLT